MALSKKQREALCVLDEAMRNESMGIDTEKAAHKIAKQALEEEL